MQNVNLHSFLPRNSDLPTSDDVATTFSVMRTAIQGAPFCLFLASLRCCWAVRGAYDAASESAGLPQHVHPVVRHPAFVSSRAGRQT